MTPKLMCMRFPPKVRVSSSNMRTGSTIGCFPVCPKPPKGTNKAARKAANQLNAVIKAIENGAQPACGFMCDVESDSISSLSCDECLGVAMPPHDVRKDVKAPRAATPVPKGKDVWLIDSGSEQDLICKAALRNAAKAVRKPSEIADISVDALCACAALKLSCSAVVGCEVLGPRILLSLGVRKGTNHGSPGWCPDPAQG